MSKKTLNIAILLVESHGMSFIFLHVGQCGNQLGQAFWEEAGSSKWRAPAQHPSAKASGGPKTKLPSTSLLHMPYTLSDGFIPSILIDAEPKVIRNCAKSNFASQIRDECVVTDKTGRGNNWAFGYHGRKETGCTLGLLERTVESVRKCLERCDRFGGFIMFHSISGGTGSGFGSALLENLREEHPLSSILSVVVTPFSHGETPLQHLNSALCISWLQSYSDAILLFGNDSVMDQMRRQHGSAVKSSASSSSFYGSDGRRKGQRDGNDVTMADMNCHISGVLCNVFMPIWQPKQGLPNLSCQEPWELIRSISPNPTHKFLSPNHVQLAHPTSRWSQAMSHLLHHGSTSSWSGQDPTKAQTSSLLLVIRGSPTGMETFSPPGQWNALETKLKKAYGAVEWNPFPVDCWRSYEKGFGHLKQATIVANSSAVLDYLVGVRERAKVMWENGAYLHWYERYGCDKDTFTDAFAVMDTIIDSYINM